MDFKIEPGQFYTLRDGSKYRNYATDGGGEYPVHGVIQSGQEWTLCMHGHNGRANWSIVDSPWDIIGPWIDKPEVDWSLYSRSTKSVAKDSDGRWFEYQNIPIRSTGTWPGSPRYPIPPALAPKFTGDWKDSLVIRP